MRKHALFVITTGNHELDTVAGILKACPTRLIDAFHIREKQRGARELLRWHEALKPLLPETQLYINDRVDAAAAAGADGVQLGAAGLPPHAARKLMPPGARIGCSVHSAAEAREAGEQGADFVIYGHVYSTFSKAGLAPRGLEALAEAVQAAPVPVIAIGGITPERVPAVLATGCAGIAVLSGILAHPQPDRQIHRYREALDASINQPRRIYT